MEKEIRLILSGLPDVRVSFFGGLWSVCVGGLSGSSTDGLELARRLKSQYEYIKPRIVSVPQPMEEPVQVGHMDEPDDLEIPRFLAPTPAESVPTDIEALAEPGETVNRTQLRLWLLYRDLTSKIMMGIATREEIALQEKLHVHELWLRQAHERNI